MSRLFTAFPQGVLALTVPLLLVSVAAGAAPFTYQPAGVLKPGSGTGLKTATVYAPNMRFPIEKAPAYANSQVWGVGGMNGPSGSTCDAKNFAYPWWDNYCETRSWSMPLCPAGKGHQGQDIRAASCAKNVHWAVAAEDGTITSIGTYSVYLKGASGTTFRYLHMEPSSLQVKTGSKVSKGQKLGRVSNAFGGTPTSVHLHFDVQQYVKNVGTVFVSPYLSLVKSYQGLVGPTCDAAACAAKSSCEGWSDCKTSTPCDTSGEKTRTCTKYACSGGTCGATKSTEKQACQVKTDGKVVALWTAWGKCGGFSSVCDESGEQSRTQKVCKSGKESVVTETKACTTDTDGKVLQGWSAWSACGSFDGPCDQTGEQSRTQKVCKSGKESVVVDKQACQTVTDGKVVSPWGAWGPCGGFDGPCDESGSQTRSQTVCKGGTSSAQSQTQACTTSKEGLVVEPWGEWGPCGGFDGPCDPDGTRSRTRKTCAKGLVATESEEESCSQAVDCPDVTGGSTQPDSSGTAGQDAADAEAGEPTPDSAAAKDVGKDSAETGKDSAETSKDSDDAKSPTGKADADVTADVPGLVGVADADEAPATPPVQPAPVADSGCSGGPHSTGTPGLFTMLIAGLALVWRRRQT